MMKPVKVGRINYANLIPSSALAHFNPDTALRRLRTEVLKKVRANLTQTTFSNAAKVALAKALRITVKPSSLMITATHPAFMVFMKGRKRKQMGWLIKARTPIPIVTETGQVIFRRATAQSMKGGGWVHPGRSSSNFLDKAREDARKILKTRLAQDLRRQIAAKLLGRRLWLMCGSSTSKQACFRCGIFR